MTNTNHEIELLDKLCGAFCRPPYQLNEVYTSDAELVHLWNDGGGILAATTDGLVEELASGLYQDPYLAGWMVVMANLSDLAAVGATPIGILLAETLPSHLDEGWLQSLQTGIADACKRCETYVLGGDTNFSDHLGLTASAFGMVRGNPLTRRGCKPGDVLFSSGVLGSGNGFALNQHCGKNGSYAYLPVARVKEGTLAAEFGSAGMDTSDGAIATLDELMRLNDVGFIFDERWESAIDNAATDLAKSVGIPPWFMLAGSHGEYELLLTIPKQMVDQFLARANVDGWNPIRLGTVTPEAGLRMKIYGRMRFIDSARLRNIFFEHATDVDYCIKQLLEYDYTLRMEG